MTLRLCLFTILPQNITEKKKLPWSSFRREQSMSKMSLPADRMAFTPTPPLKPVLQNFLEALISPFLSVAFALPALYSTSHLPHSLIVTLRSNKKFIHMSLQSKCYVNTCIIKEKDQSNLHIHPLHISHLFLQYTKTSWVWEAFPHMFLLSLQLNRYSTLVHSLLQEWLLVCVCLAHIQALTLHVHLTESTFVSHVNYMSKRKRQEKKKKDECTVRMNELNNEYIISS